MNDFTKEELLLLRKLTLQDVNLFRQNSAFIELNAKIRTLIDNYCVKEASDKVIKKYAKALCNLKDK